MKRIRTKVTALFLFVSITGVLGTIFVATHLFVLDKADYVMELNSIAAPNVASAIGRHLQHLQEQAAMFDDVLQSQQKQGGSNRILENVFRKLTGVQQLDVFDAKGPLVSMAFSADQQKLVHDRAFIEELMKSTQRMLSRNPLQASTSLVLSFWVKTRFYCVVLNPDSLQDYFESAHAMSVALADEHGTILASNHLEDQRKKLSQNVFRDLLASIEFRDKHTVIAKRFKLGTQEQLAAISPIPDTQGAMVIVQAPAASVWMMVNQILKNSIPFVTLILVLAAILGIIFSAQIVAPIEELTEATSQIASGNWKVHFKMRAKNELGRLGAAFTKMGNELASREEALNKAHIDLMRSEKLAALGKFGAGIAHEVKNPLNSILGFAQLIQQKMGASADDTTKKYLGFILDETRRANSIIIDILGFARQKPPTLAVVKMSDFLNRMGEIFSPQAVTANAEIVISAADPSIECNIDKDQITQVLSNLVFNAIHAMEENPPEKPRRVVVTLSRKSTHAAIEVIDSGSGISPENLNKLFEPFFSTKRSGKGTGLGLSMSHGIITQHLGKIEVNSTVGIGTTFTILLPLSPSGQI